MAQDFERVLKQNIGTSATEVRAAANSDDAIIGMRFANKSGSTVTVDDTVKNSSTSYYLIKDAPVPSGSSLELLAGNKIVLEDTDEITLTASGASDITISIMEIT